MALYTSKVRANNRMTKFWSSLATGNSTNPALIPNLIFRYRGDSITGSNGSDIATWPDISGFGRDLTAIGAAGNRPIVQTSGLNGFTVLKNVAKSGLAITNAGVVPTAANTFSLYMVFRMDATGINDIFGWKDGNASGMRCGLDGSASALFDVTIPNVGAFNSTTSLNITGNWNRLSIVANAGTWTVQIASSTLAWSGSPPSGSLNGSVGGIQVAAGVNDGRAMTGQIAEVIGYNRALTSDEIVRLDSYAKSTFGIA